MMMFLSQIKYTPRLIALLVVLAAFYLLFQQFHAVGFLADEVVHFAQIQIFNGGLEPGIIGNLTTIPGYHLLIAGIATVVDATTLFEVRLASGLLSVLLLLILVRYFLACEHCKFPLIRALQIFFLPLIFHLHFLLYTDISSLLFFVLLFSAALKARFWQIVAWSICCFLVRQNNMVWVVFCWLSGYVKNFEGFPISSDLPELRKGIFGFIRSSPFVYSLAFLPVFAVFVSFFIWNGGLVLGDRLSHPAGFYAGNIVFALFLGFFFFLPLHISNFGAVAKFAKQNHMLSLVGILSPIALVLYAFGKPNLYNTFQGSYFIHNRMFQYLLEHELARIPFSILVALTLISLVVTRFHYIRPASYLFFSGLFLCSSWLVEFRYYTIPFVLLHMTRPEGGWKSELGLLIAYMATSLGIFYLVATSKGFL